MLDVVVNKANFCSKQQSLISYKTDFTCMLLLATAAWVILWLKNKVGSATRHGVRLQKGFSLAPTFRVSRYILHKMTPLFLRCRTAICMHEISMNEECTDSWRTEHHPLSDAVLRVAWRKSQVSMKSPASNSRHCDQTLLCLQSGQR